MTAKLKDFLADLTATERRQVDRRARGHLKAMEDARRLDEIRRAASRTQSEIAAAMGIGQNAVSQLETRRDLQLSTLHRYIASMGFRLEIAVVAPSGERVALKNFKPWDDWQPPAAKVGSAPAARKKSGTARRETAVAAKETRAPRRR